MNCKVSNENGSWVTLPIKAGSHVRKRKPLVNRDDASTSAH